MSKNNLLASAHDHLRDLENYEALRNQPHLLDHLARLKTWRLTRRGRIAEFAYHHHARWLYRKLAKNRGF